MTAPRALLCARLLELPGLEARRSRCGPDVAFFLEGAEIAHFHADDEIDVRLTKKVLRINREALAGDPRVVPRRSASDWVAVRFATAQDAEFAASLVRLAYEARLARLLPE
jgi:hypothetical protein